MSTLGAKGARDRVGESRPNIVVASPLDTASAQRLIDAVIDCANVVFRPDLLPIPRYPADHDGLARDLTADQIHEWKDILASADILFDFDWYAPSDLPVTAPNVRWVQATSSGIGEFVRRTGLERWDAAFTTAAGVHAVPLAEFVLLGLLYMTKDVPRLRSWQAAHHWQRHASSELAGQRALIVGLGQVGRSVAHTLRERGVEVWGIRRRTDPVADVSVLMRAEELRSALPEVDALILCCPYTEATHHLIGRDELSLLRSSAVLVNVARGAVVDETALISALTDGVIKGAVLDVAESEPLPKDSPLWDMDNVLISPHSASTSPLENVRLVDLFIDNFSRYTDGKDLRNLFNRSNSY